MKTVSSWRDLEREMEDAKCAICGCFRHHRGGAVRAWAERCPVCEGAGHVNTSICHCCNGRCWVLMEMPKDDNAEGEV